MNRLRLHRPSQRGWTLVELMIGITIGMLMLIALGSLYFSTTQSRSLLASVSDQIESARYALDMIGHETELAGFYGETGQARSATVSMPSLCATTSTALGFANSPVTMPVPIQGFAAGTVASCLPNLSAQSEILAIRRVSTTSAAAATASATTGQAYLQNSACGSDPVPFVFDTSAAAFTLQTKACTSSALAPLRAAVVRIFYLAACDNCTGSGDGIPTLKMAELINGAFQVNSIAQGIQDMHFSFGVDQDNNGSADCYVDNPGIDNSGACTSVTGYSWATPSANWHNVTSVRISLLARTTTRANGWTDTRQYDLGRSSPSGPFNDGYKRHVYAQVARLANVAGPRE